MTLRLVKIEEYRVMSPERCFSCGEQIAKGDVCVYAKMDGGGNDPYWRKQDYRFHVDCWEE